MTFLQQWAANAGIPEQHREAWWSDKRKRLRETFRARRELPPDSEPN